MFYEHHLFEIHRLLDILEAVGNMQPRNVRRCSEVYRGCSGFIEVIQIYGLS